MKNSTRRDIEDQLDECGYIDTYTRSKIAKAHKKTAPILRSNPKDLNPEETEEQFKQAAANYKGSSMAAQSVEQKRKDLIVHPFMSDNEVIEKASDEDVIQAHEWLFTSQEAAYLSMGRSMFDFGDDGYEDY